MTGARPHGAPRQMFSDARTPQRFLRVSWHPPEQVVTLSVWGADECLATFHLPPGEVPELVAVLVEGLAADESSPGGALPWTGALNVGTPPPPASTTAQQANPPSPAREHTVEVPSTSRQTALRALDLLVARAADTLRARLDRLDPNRSSRRE